MTYFFYLVLFLLLPFYFHFRCLINIPFILQILFDLVLHCLFFLVFELLYLISFLLVFIPRNLLSQFFFRLLFFIGACFKFYLIAVLICYLDFLMYHRAHNVFETLWWASIFAKFVTGGLEIGRKWDFGCSKNILFSAEVCWGVQL